MAGSQPQTNLQKQSYVSRAFVVKPVYSNKVSSSNPSQRCFRPTALKTDNVDDTIDALAKFNLGRIQEADAKNYESYGFNQSQTPNSLLPSIPNNYKSLANNSVKTFGQIKIIGNDSRIAQPGTINP